MLTQKILERAHVYTACPLFVWKLGYNQLIEVRSVSQATHFGLLSTHVLYMLIDKLLYWKPYKVPIKRGHSTWTGGLVHTHIDT